MNVQKYLNWNTKVSKMKSGSVDGKEQGLDDLRLTVHKHHHADTINPY